MILNLSPRESSLPEPFETVEIASTQHFDKIPTKNILTTPLFRRYLQNLSMSAVSPENQSIILELLPLIGMSPRRLPNREMTLNYHFQTIFAQNMFVVRIKNRLQPQITAGHLKIHQPDGCFLSIDVSMDSLLGLTALGSSDLVLQTLNIPSSFLVTSFSQFDYSQQLKDFEREFRIDKWIKTFPYVIISDALEDVYYYFRKYQSFFDLTLDERLTQLLKYFYGIIAYQTTQEAGYMTNQDYSIPEHTVLNVLESFYFRSSNLLVNHSIANYLLYLVEGRRRESGKTNRRRSNLLMLREPKVFSPISDVNWAIELLGHIEGVKTISIATYEIATVARTYQYNRASHYTEVEIKFTDGGVKFARCSTLETAILNLGKEYGIFPLPPMFPFTHSNLEENAWPRRIKRAKDRPKNTH